MKKLITIVGVLTISSSLFAQVIIDSSSTSRLIESLSKSGDCEAMLSALSLTAGTGGRYAAEAISLREKNRIQMAIKVEELATQAFQQSEAVQSLVIKMCFRK